MELIDLVDELSEDELMDIVNLDLDDNNKIYHNGKIFLEKFYSNDLIKFAKDMSERLYVFDDKYAKITEDSTLISSNYVSEMIGDDYEEDIAEIIEKNMNNNTIQYILKQHNFESR